MTVRRKVNKGGSGAVRVVQIAHGALFTVFVLGANREVFVAGTLSGVPVPQVTAVLGAADGDVGDLLDGIELQLRASNLSPLSSSPGSNERAILAKMEEATGDSAGGARRRQSVARRASKRSLTEAGGTAADRGLRDVIDVAAGWVHATCVTAHGTVLSAGRGILGVAKDSEVIAHSDSEGVVAEDKAA